MQERELSEEQERGLREVVANMPGVRDLPQVRDLRADGEALAAQHAAAEAAEEIALPEREEALPPVEAAPTPQERPKKGALHIERGHLEIRLSEHSYHEIRLADLSAKNDTTGLLLYAMVLQLFDVTRGLGAVAHNAGAGTALLARMEAAGRQAKAEGATELAARTMDQLFDAFERRTGSKIRR